MTATSRSRSSTPTSGPPIPAPRSPRSCGGTSSTSSTTASRIRSRRQCARDRDPSRHTHQRCNPRSQNGRKRLRMAREGEASAMDRPSRQRGGPPTIADVARLAGTSEATVSRALQGSRRVGEELRQSVLEAAKALDYMPNRHAQALARSVDATIGVVIHDTGDPYFVEILRGILGPAEESGRMVIVCDSGRDPERELKYVRHF